MLHLIAQAATTQPTFTTGDPLADRVYAFAALIVTLMVAYQTLASKAHGSLLAQLNSAVQLLLAASPPAPPAPTGVVVTPTVPPPAIDPKTVQLIADRVVAQLRCPPTDMAPAPTTPPDKTE